MNALDVSHLTLRLGGTEILRDLSFVVPFDYALIVTTICFVNEARAMLREAARVLRPGGTLVIGLVDRESPLGQDYLGHQAENVFYRAATFYSAAEVEILLEGAGFNDLVWVKTLSTRLAQVHHIEPTHPATGHGAFLVVRAARLPQGERP